MNDCFSLLKENFQDINIKYYADFDILMVRCTDIINQLSDIKKVLKILIYEIQSKTIKKDTITIEFFDKDFLNDEAIKLFNIMKLTKTSHYFNISIRKKYNSEEDVNTRIKFIKDNYAGLNINKNIAKNKNLCNNSNMSYGEKHDTAF